MKSEHQVITTGAEINVPLGRILGKLPSFITIDNHHSIVIKLLLPKSKTLHPSVIYLLRRVAPDKSTLLHLAVPCLKSFLYSNTSVSSYGETIVHYYRDYLNRWDHIRMNLPMHTTFISFEELHPSDKKSSYNI